MQGQSGKLCVGHGLRCQHQCPGQTGQQIATEDAELDRKPEKKRKEANDKFVCHGRPFSGIDHQNRAMRFPGDVSGHMSVEHFGHTTFPWSTDEDHIGFPLPSCSNDELSGVANLHERLANHLRTCLLDLQAKRLDDLLPLGNIGIPLDYGHDGQVLQGGASMAKAYGIESRFGGAW